MTRLRIAVAVACFVWAERPAEALSIIPTTDANTLVNTILGPGVALVGVPSHTGVDGQAGTFTVGGGSVGFVEGIVLSSGDVSDIPGANAGDPETLGDGIVDDDLSTNMFGPGDPALTDLAGGTTFDASILQFQFQFGDGSIGGDLFFNFVFSSDEYIDFVGSQFNDVFGFYLDGVNIALVGGSPITINNINPNVNSSAYINNVANTDGFPNALLDFKFDGTTVVLTAQALGLGSGSHTMKLAVADTTDGILDSAVFVQAGTFSTTPPGAVPEPSTLFLLGAGLVFVAGGRRYRRKKAA